MNHDHHHHETANLKSVNNAFIAGIILNFLFVITEVIAGLSIHSLSLISDAGHNLADVAALALSLFAIKMSGVKPNDKFTYGYKKTTVLVALFNAVVLLVSIGAIGYEAIHRFLNPEPLPGKIISLVAGIGIVINTSSALLFMKNKEDDLNIKSAFMHLISDAIVSAGLVIGGIVIFYTNFYWIDPVLSIIIAVVILLNTWSLLRDSLKLSMDAVPEGINLETVRLKIKSKAGVVDFHHIHIWAISTTQNAMTAHLVVDRETSPDQLEKIKSDIKHELQHLKIHHSTLETELNDQHCDDPGCDEEKTVEPKIFS
jgi:cobalt-zinc-cadmium efflux system protein